MSEEREVRGRVRRRVLLGGAAGVLGTGALGACVADPWRPVPRPDVPWPFTLGVASGDPTPDGVVLWTRLAPDPFAPDGRGGMPDRSETVSWQVAEDERFRRVVASGATTATAEDAHAVHVEVRGLRPGAEHFYRFRTDAHVGPVGRTRTAPAPDADPGRMAFAFASCQNREDGFYPAHAGIAAEDLDLVVFLGDYIYEAAGRDLLGRAHRPPREVTSLADYRVRLAQYKTDPDLQAAHAAHPWAVTLDDHEIENNWTAAGSTPDGEPDGDPRTWRHRRAQALRAYYEHMPLRSAQRPRGPDAVLHRRLGHGRLLDLHLLDTRQHRSASIPATRFDPAAADPDSTVLGARQEAWLRDGLARSTARWTVLGQQVPFTPLRGEYGADPDSWAGHPAARARLIDDLLATRARNPVVITGDVHAHHVCDVLAPDRTTAATELITTSITTGGNGPATGADDAVLLARAPAVRWIDHHRGYVRAVVTPDQWTTDFRVVDDVSRRGAPVRTEATFVIADGRPGAVRYAP